MLDLILTNGRIVDGTGNPWLLGDVGVKDGQIVALGQLLHHEAGSVIDVHRQVIAPGFIDGHCHSDLMILDHPFSEIKIQQGVTTEVVGNCGLAPAPFVQSQAELLQSYVQPVLGSTAWAWPWETVGQYMETVAASRPTEEAPRQYPEGISHVFVSGKATLLNGQHTHAREGSLIRACHHCQH